MPIRIQCPSPECGAVCSAKESVSGKTVKCPKCSKPFAVRTTLDGHSQDTRKSRPTSSADPFPSLPAEFGRYRVVKLLGQGGMGAVYLAQDTQLGRKVALKIPFIDGGDQKRVDRFTREARSAAALHHPNICTVFDAGTIDGRPFISMAYLAGTPLDQLIDPENPMPPQRAAEVARGIARALAYAHENGVVHRDLKPANVMLTTAGEPVVMDFGLAKFAGDVEANEVKLTREGGLLGTPSYMAPEQVRGEAATGPAADVYALGVVLFELLTGRPPYVGSLAAVIGQIMSAPVPPLREFRPNAPLWLEGACSKAMAKVPGERFESMTEFAKVLDLYLSDPAPASHSISAPVTASPPVPPVPQPPPVPLVEIQTSVPSFNDLTDDTPQPQKKRTQASRPIWRRPIVVAMAVLLAVGTVLAAIVLRLETPNGTLVVEIDDPNVEGKIKDGKLILSDSDGKDRYTLSPAAGDKRIDAGAYKVRVEGADGLVLDTNEFTLKKGDTVRVAVRMESKPVAKADPVKPQSNTAGTGFTNPLGMKFVWVPPGKSWLGGADGRVGKVEFASKDGFWFGAYMVTQEEWEAVMGSNTSRWSRTGEGSAQVASVSDKDLKRFPAENMSYRDAQVFVQKLNDRLVETGVTYRLPSADEWEYVCRGGPMTAVEQSRFNYYFVRSRTDQTADPSNEIKNSQANIRNIFGRTTKVDAYLPNALAVYDLHGNLHQWTSTVVEGDRLICGGMMGRDDGTAAHRYTVLNWPTGGNGGNIGIRLLAVPYDRAKEYDRSAAEYVLSVGGTVRVNDGTHDINSTFDLPRGMVILNGVYLSGNPNVTDEGLKALKNCTSLKELFLDRTLVTDAGLVNFKGQTSLVSLGLNMTQMTDDGIKNFKDCTNLQWLNLSDTIIGDAGILSLSGCTKMGRAELNGTKITDDGWAVFKKWKALNMLVIENTKIKGQGLSCLVECKRLNELHLGSSHELDPSNLKYLKVCSSLSKLRLFDTGVTDSDLPDLHYLKNLVRLNLNETKVTKDGLEQLNKALPNCAVFNFR